MTDDPKNGRENGGWQMPEPVFRSSEGKPIGKTSADSQVTDTPDSTIHDETVPGISSTQTVRAAETTRVRRSKNRKGCVSHALSIVGISLLMIAAVLGIAVYYIFF